jgi:hypothetical protein
MNLHRPRLPGERSLAFIARPLDRSQHLSLNTRKPNRYTGSPHRQRCHLRRFPLERDLHLHQWSAGATNDQKTKRPGKPSLLLASHPANVKHQPPRPVRKKKGKEKGNKSAPADSV